MFKLFKTKGDKSRAVKLPIAVGSAVTVAAVAVLLTTGFLSATTGDRVNEFSGKPPVVPAGNNYTDTSIYEIGAVTATGNVTSLNSEEGSYTARTQSGTLNNKTVIVQNPADDKKKKPVFVRVRLIVSGESSKTSEGSDYETLADVSISPTNLSSDWYDGGDGYYYYKHVLYPDHYTQPLFKANEPGSKESIPEGGGTGGGGKVEGQFEPETLNYWMKSEDDFTITFVADTVQACANGRPDITTDFIEKAWGYTPSVGHIETDCTPEDNCADVDAIGKAY